MNLGLFLSTLRGQGYDGASTMSGSKTGLQARIRECQPKALYTHCAGHSFNLAIMNSCSIPCNRNCIDQIKNFTLFVKTFPKREGLLKAIASKNTLVHTSSRVPLLKMDELIFISLVFLSTTITGHRKVKGMHSLISKLWNLLYHDDTVSFFALSKRSSG